MRFCIPRQRQRRNCALLQNSPSRILVDAGFSASRLGLLWAGSASRLTDRRGLPHARTRRPHRGSAACRAIRTSRSSPITPRRARPGRIEASPRLACFETGARFRFRDLEIESFAVPHDAHDPVAFSARNGRMTCSRRPGASLGDDLVMLRNMSGSASGRQTSSSSEANYCRRC